MKSGADTGIKAALSGAVKVGAEKGLIRLIPKGTPVAAITTAVHIGVENVKIASKVASGELTPLQGMDRAAQTTISAVAGIAASAKGATVGAAIGTALGPVGTVVGGLVGGIVGYAAGSAVGDAAYKGVKKLASHAAKAVKSTVSAVKAVGSRIFGKAKALLGV